MGSFYPGTAVSLLTSSCKDMVMARFLGIFSRQQRWHTNIWSCLNTFVSRSLFIYYLFILLNTFAIIYTWLLTMALDNYPIQLETTLSSSFLWEVRLLMNRGIQQWLRIDIYITIHQNVHNKQHSYHLATEWIMENRTITDLDNKILVSCTLSSKIANICAPKAKQLCKQWCRWSIRITLKQQRKWRTPKHTSM